MALWGGRFLEPTDADLKALNDFLMLRDRKFSEPAKSERPIYSHNGYPKFLDHEGYPANNAGPMAAAPSTGARKCAGTKADGQPCGAYAITDSDFCINHGK